ncbi:hypothetical protein AZOA_47990 [Azoarcus sp. Aa7]|nr:hypothetical protein [Azoarcus sp. Aa7]
MQTKRNLITRDMVVRANEAMVKNRTANVAGLPTKVVAVIRETKVTREEMNRAFAEARRAVEADA